MSNEKPQPTTLTTRAGCVVTVQRVGTAVGVTIKQASGKSDTFTCGADEAAQIALMLATVSQ